MKEEIKNWQTKSVVVEQEHSNNLFPMTPAIINQEKDIPTQANNFEKRKNPAPFKIEHLEIKPRLRNL